MISEETLRPEFRGYMERTGFAMPTRQFGQYHCGVVKHLWARNGDSDVMNGTYYEAVMPAQTIHSAARARSFTVLAMDTGSIWTGFCLTSFGKPPSDGMVRCVYSDTGRTAQPLSTNAALKVMGTLQSVLNAGI